MNDIIEAAAPKLGRGKSVQRSRAELQAEFAAAADEALLRVRTVSVVCEESETKTWARIAAGELAAVRLSRRCTRVRAGEVRRFLNAQAA